MLQSIFVSLATRYMYMVFLCPSSFIDEMSWWRQRGRMSSVVDFLLLQHNIFISYRSATNNNVIEYMKGPFMYIWLTMKDMIVGQENKSQHEWKKRLKAQNQANSLSICVQGFQSLCCIYTYYKNWWQNYLFSVYKHD